MDNYSYPTSYPESGESSPRSREIDFENTPPWEEPPPQSSNNYKVKFMCSYGGKIHPRPHDNQLSYVGGETKILAVDRSVKFAGIVAKLSALCDADVSFKYQLPGEDLDALISVTNDDDLNHMMHEYDRLNRSSLKPARLRLFLFPVSQTSAASGGGSFSSSEGKSDRERFVDALNSGPIQSSTPPSAAAPPNNVDFLFGLEKGIAPPPPPVATKVHTPAPVPEISVPHLEDRVIGPDPIQSQIPDLQRLQISAQEQAMYRKRSDENLVSAFSGDYYAQKFQEKLPPANLPAVAPAPATSPPGYWQENHAAGGYYPATTPFPEQQQVYMIPTPTGMYHAPPMGRPVTGPTGQGYYAVQRMPPEVYRDHQPSVYNVAPPATAAPPPTLPTQVARPTMVETGYTQVAYDGGAGRQVYYTPQGGGAMPLPPAAYQAMAAADMRPAGGLNQEGKVVVKASQAAV